MRRSILFAVLGLASAATACLTVVGAGKAPVAVASETALIVWDPKTHLEHFIRTAEFRGASGSLGFLVPTPSAPHLRPLDAFSYGQAMRFLEGQIAPRIVTKPQPTYRLSHGWDFTFPPGEDVAATKSLATGAMMYAGDADDDLSVVSRRRVGSYDTAVLRASKPKALLAWLKRNGFESDARLEGWLKPYTERGWAITAFRFAPKRAAFTSDPIVLSFQTDRPFYPYREPLATNAPASRSLRVYLVAPERRAGRLADGPWSTAAEYAGPVTSAAVPEIAGNLDLPDEAFQDRWLTCFLDRRPVRPESDLFFEADAASLPTEPPPVVRYRDRPVEIPKGLAATVVGGPLIFAMAVLVRRSRRNQ